MEQTTPEETALLAKYSRRNSKKSNEVRSPPKLQGTSSTKSWDSYQDETSSIWSKGSVSTTNYSEERSTSSSQKLPPLHPNSFAYIRSSKKKASRQPRALFTSSDDDETSDIEIQRTNSEIEMNDEESREEDDTCQQEPIPAVPDVMEVSNFLNEVAERPTATYHHHLDYKPIWIRDVLDKRNLFEDGCLLNNDLLSGTIVSNATIQVSNKDITCLHFCIQDALGEIIPVLYTINTNNVSDKKIFRKKKLNFFRKKNPEKRKLESLFYLNKR